MAILEIISIKNMGENMLECLSVKDPRTTFCSIQFTALKMSPYRRGLQRNEIKSVRTANCKRMEVNGESGLLSEPKLHECETLIVKSNGKALDASVFISFRPAFVVKAASHLWSISFKWTLFLCAWRLSFAQKAAPIPHICGPSLVGGPS